MTQARPPERAAIPDGWRMARLGDLSEVIMGQSPPGDLVVDWDGSVVGVDGLPFIQGNAEFGAKYPSPMKWCTRRFKVGVPGDTLISVRAPVGETNRTNIDIGIGRGLAAVRFPEKSQAFGWHILNHSKNALARVAQGSTFRAIGSGDLRSLPILLPPIAERRAIAEILDSIDRAIESSESAIAATAQLRDSLLHELLTRGVPGWHTEWKQARGIGTMPADWRIARLGEVAEVRNEQTRQFENPETPYVALEHIEQGGVLIDIGKAADAISAKRVFCEGDTLYGKLRPNLRKVIRAQFEGVCSSEILPIVAKDPVCAEILSHVLASDPLYRYAMRGITGTRMPRTSWDHLRAFRIPLPPIPEQQTIAAMLDSVDAAIERSREERDKLESLKASTADALLTGRARVSV